MVDMSHIGWPSMAIIQDPTYFFEVAEAAKDWYFVQVYHKTELGEVSYAGCMSNSSDAPASDYSRPSGTMIFKSFEEAKIFLNLLGIEDIVVEVEQGKYVIADRR